jgi:sn-glycerol 3-phosphate transport system substrate-binding protein
VNRRRFLGACVGALAAAGCRRATHRGIDRTRREDGRLVCDLWFSYGGNNREVLLDLVDRFNRSQRDIRVRATYQGDYWEALAKLRTAIAAGVAPAFSHVIGEVLPYLTRAGVLEPLDGYEGATEHSFVPALEQRGTFRGGADQPLIAIPFNRSTPIMYLDGRILDGAHPDPPRTWEELAAAAERLTRRSDGETRWGFEVPISWWFWVAMVGQAGGRLLDDDGTPILGGPAGEKSLRFWQDLVRRRVMRPPPGRDFNAWEVVNQDFLAGRAAIVWTSTAFMRFLEKNARFPVVAAPLPHDVRASVPTGGTFFVILRQAPAEEKQAAWRFLRFMCEPEQVIAWSSRTGYLPVTLPAIARLESSGYYASHPNDLAAYRQLAAADPWPWAESLFRIERDVVEPRLEAAILSGRDPAEVLAEARVAARQAW